MSPRQLAARAGLNEQQVLVAEKTGRADVSILAALANALGGSIDDLLARRSFWEAPAFALKCAHEGIEPEAARSGLMRAAVAGRIQADLCLLLGIPDLWNERGALLGPKAVEGEPARQAEGLAIQVRKALENENEPFVSVRDAMWRLGIATFLVEFASDSIDGGMWRHRGAAPCAAVNTLARQELVTAWRMSFAHELCHALFDRPKQGRTGIIEMRTEGGDARERRANAFAAYFIAPRSAVNRFLAELGLGSTEKPTDQHLLALSRHFGLGVEAMAWHLVNCDRWSQGEVLRHRSLVSPPFASADDRELRASPVEKQVPIERRGTVLDLATQALSQRKISVARWRELVGLPLVSNWQLLLSQRSVEVYPES